MYLVLLELSTVSKPRCEIARSELIQFCYSKNRWLCPLRPVAAADFVKNSSSLEFKPEQLIRVFPGFVDDFAENKSPSD
jgi:hypothetical protein